MDAFDWIIDPFRMQLMQYALAAVLIAAVGCAALGVQVVLRRMSFMGDAMAHATLPGVVMSFLLGWNLLVGALGAALLAALGIAWASRSGKVNEDSAIGILYTGMFALGVVLLNRIGSYRDLTHVLLGNPMGVTDQDLWIMAAVVGVICLGLFLMRRELAITLIDPQYARSIGVSPGLMRALVLIGCACTVVIAIRVVGVILTAALIITPAASARLLASSLAGTTAIAVTIACVGCVVGMIASYHWHLAMGATMVLSITSIFVILRIIVALPRLRGSSRRPPLPPVSSAQ